VTLSIPEITAEDARILTDRIKVGVEAVWHLITEAYTSRAYIALGYRNWDDYCTREFGTSRLRLPREERAEVVASLRESGLSIRAIASATGLDKKTVNRDVIELSQKGTPNPTPRSTVALEELAGELGADLDEPDNDPPLSQEECEALDDVEFCDGSCGDGLCECIAGECSCGFLPTPDARVTGTDGKSYPIQPRPSEPKRKALPDSFWRATFDIGKEITRIEKLAADDRFNRNADQIAQANLHDLIRARDALQRVIDKLNPTGV